MQRSEKEKLVEKLRRAADAQRRAFPGNLYHNGIAQGIDNAAGIIGKIRCEEVPEWCTDCKEYDAEAKSCSRFSRVIRATMEEAKPKTGRWIDCGASYHWKCDQCGCRAGFWFDEENSSSWDLNMSEWMSNFCPNCGARMKGDTDE